MLRNVNLYNPLEFVYEMGIEAFNLLNFFLFPLDPLQKLLIKDGHSLQTKRIFMQTMTAFDLFKVIRKKTWK